MVLIAYGNSGGMVLLVIGLLMVFFFFGEVLEVGMKDSNKTSGGAGEGPKAILTALDPCWASWGRVLAGHPVFHQPGLLAIGVQ